MRASIHPIRGAGTVARFLSSPAVRSGMLTVGELHLVRINGDPAIAAYAEDGSPRVIGVLDINPRSERIRNIFVVANPDKLTRRLSTRERPAHEY